MRRRTNVEVSLVCAWCNGEERYSSGWSSAALLRVATDSNTGEPVKAHIGGSADIQASVTARNASGG
jgi:hypothetical protein